MAFRGLVEGDCGGANPLMQLGGHFTRDAAYTEEGFARQQQGFNDNVPLHQEQMVNEFLGQIAGPPQTFRMDNLLDEMRSIEQQNFHPPVINAPKVIQEVTSTAGEWTYDFTQNNNKQEIRTAPRAENLEGAVGGLPIRQQMYAMPVGISRNWNQSNFINVQPVQANITYAQEFFDDTQQKQENSVQNFFDKEEISSNVTMKNTPEVEHITDEWLEDFQKNKEEEAEKSNSYYDKFWSKLQKDWNDLAEYDDHSWLTHDADFNPYKEYNFIVENNPMIDNENALEKGKELLAKGDIPSAVICFEAAVRQEANAQNPYAWELLGLSQAENEMDPHAISALIKSLELKPDNLNVLMALSVSYTNESLQNQALNMLVQWLHYHPKYKHLVPSHLVPSNNNETIITSSLISPSSLKEIQNIYIDVVQKYPEQIDADVQEALGVLFNLSSEYDKAVDCFKAAIHANPANSKTWNRLGASLANGNRSVEAVEAYKRALELQPGFIRARYNVGIICMNLKSYKEAAEHLLTALNMQATSPNRTGLSTELMSNANQMSDVIWSTLRMVFALMGRDDYKILAANRDLDGLNRELKLT